ncbi:hypothetical protein MRX96_024800 [Rhipicephalus microplus]
MNRDDTEVRVLHCSAHFLVVDKPADLVINTQKEHEHPVSVESLLRRQLPELVDPSVEHGFRFCHRLDFATSGVLCLALTRAGARAAQASLGPPLRTARKCYAALLGWTCGLAYRVAEARTRILVLGWGLFHGRPATQAVLKPVTGRRHQLRVHCATLGHPVVGDTTYGDASAAVHSRMYLHAWRLLLPTQLAVVDVSTGSEHPFGCHQAWQDVPSQDRPKWTVDDAFEQLECSELFLAWSAQSPKCCTDRIQGRECANNKCS